MRSLPTTELVKELRFSDGRTITYGYDALGRLTHVHDSAEGAWEYTYDTLGQLLTEHHNGEAVNVLTYDGYGNILTKNGVVYTYGDPTHRDLLTAVGGESITYDEMGNPTAYLGGHTLTWGKGRTLLSFDGNSYTYNSSGLRIKKTVGAVTHTYSLAGAQLLCERFGEHTLIPLYTEGEAPVGLLYDGTPYYFRKNQQGDVLAIVNEGGHTVATYTYDAFGVPTLAVGSAEIGEVNPFRYRGYYYDAETGLYYLASRYYDPALGRFLNADEPSIILYGPTSPKNLFSYCNNSPTNDRDSFGFAPDYTQSRYVNKMLESILDSVPNVYSSDFKLKETEILHIGTHNLYVKMGIGACVQSNKNALFGELFKLGTLEVSAYLGITNVASFSFSSGIDREKVYLKFGLGIAVPRGTRASVYVGVYVELSVPTWFLVASAAAVAVAAVYNPAISAYLAKILKAVGRRAQNAARLLVPIIPKLAVVI